MLLHEPFDFHAFARPGYVLARLDGLEWTYAQGRERSLRIASALLELGLEPGERIATIVKNSIDALLIMYAAARTGIVCVPLNCRLAPREWMGLIEDAEARVVIADPIYCEALEDAGGKPPIAISSQCPRPGWLGLDELVAQASFDIPPLPISAEAPVLQLYTSGTTGKPKGAIISHRSILANISQISFTAGNCSPRQRSLHVLPMFHIAAVVFALRAISGGETLVILKEANPATLLRKLIDEEIAWMMIVPTIIQMLLNEPSIGELHFPHLRQMVYGASPIAQHVLVNAMRTFGCGFVQGFGMTELSGVGTILTEDDHARALSGRPDLLSSAGHALPGTELRIVNADGGECPVGEIGEICIRGPQVVSGYWKVPDATEAALRDGWLHTGDAGSLDDEGYLFIRDRLKDMIVSGGENIYPAEVEAVLHQHPHIAEVSVIGIPDDLWGETVMAVVVPEKGCELNEAELDRHCRANLGGFKLPRRYTFVDSLPRNASGKVLKRDLRAAFWSGQSRQVS